MASPLDFPSSEVFRKKLIVRNLVPYKKTPGLPSPPFQYEVIQRDLSPVDSNDALSSLRYIKKNSPFPMDHKKRLQQSRLIQNPIILYYIKEYIYKRETHISNENDLFG